MAMYSAPASRRMSGRLFLTLGSALAVLGICAYVAQIKAGRLETPWYLPPSATAAALLIFAATWQRRTVWRLLALLLVVLLAGAEWTFVFITRLPPYTGPLVVGKPFPAFSTSRSDGTPFTQDDVIGEQNNVLVFFRGRW